MISREGLDLMRLTVRKKGPRHIRLRSVGYAENILNQHDLRKVPDAHGLRLKRLHDHQDHDTNH